MRGFLGLALLLGLAGCGAPAGEVRLSPEARARLAATQPPSLQRLAALRDALARDAGNAAILAEIAAVAEALGQHGEAAWALRALMEREGASERRLVQVGRLLLRAEDHAGAARAFGEAMAVNPRSAAAAGGLGLAHDMLGERQAAQAAYRRGLDAAPSDWTLRANYGMSLVSSARPDEAARVLADAEFLPSAPRPARHNLALALSALGETDRAVRVLRAEMGPAEALALAEEMRLYATGSPTPPR